MRGEGGCTVAAGGEDTYQRLSVLVCRTYVVESSFGLDLSTQGAGSEVTSCLATEAPAVARCCALM